MGPRPSGRGTLHAGWEETLRNLRRQWGRGRVAAERRKASETSVDVPSVNGAAAEWPRNDYWFRTHKDMLQMRQWGRGRVAAERSLAAGRVRTSEARQWGRGRVAAERSPQ